MIFIYLLALIIFILFTNKFLLKNNILINETGDIHQKFSSKSSVPLTGGIFIFLGFLFYYKGIYSFILFSFIILILGILSDLKLVRSAKKKLLLQIVIILFYVIFNDIQLTDTRINFLNIFSICFYPGVMLDGVVVASSSLVFTCGRRGSGGASLPGVSMASAKF